MSFCPVIASPETTVDWVFLLRVAAIEIIVFTNASIGLYALQFLQLYQEMFSVCFEEIECCLRENLRVKVSLLKNKNGLQAKLQRLQRFYLTILRNFNLALDYIQPEILVVYSVNVCLFLIFLWFFSVIYLTEGLELKIFDQYIAFKSGAIIGVFVLFCNRGDNIRNGGQKTLSFLFRYPTSILTDCELMQVETLIQTLARQKPVINGWNLFKIDNVLIASVIGTVLTYGLVALQFHQMLKEKIKL